MGPHSCLFCSHNEIKLPFSVLGYIVMGLQYFDATLIHPLVCIVCIDMWIRLVCMNWQLLHMPSASQF